MNTETQPLFESEPPRHTYVGASEIAAALGLSVYERPIEVWARKTGRRRQKPETGDTLRGRFLEPIIRDHCVTVDPRIEKLFGPEGFHQLDNPHVGCHDDGTLVGFGFPKMGTLEIKCPNRFTFQTIQEQGLPNQNILQIMLSMGLRQMEWGGFAVHCADTWETLIFPVEFDPKVFEWLNTQASAFMRTFVEKDQAPPDLVVDNIPTLPVIKGEADYTEDDAWAELMNEWEIVRQTKKLCEEKWEGTKEEPGGLKKAILGAMDSSKVIIGGGYKVTRVQSHGKLTFSKDAVEAAGLLDPSVVEEIVRHQLRFAFRPDADAKLELAELLGRFKLEARANVEDPRFHKKSDPFEYPLATPLKEG